MYASYLKDMLSAALCRRSLVTIECDLFVVVSLSLFVPFTAVRLPPATLACSAVQSSNKSREQKS